MSYGYLCSLLIKEIKFMKTILVQCNCGFEIMEVNENIDPKSICNDCNCYTYVKDYTGTVIDKLAKGRYE